MLEAKILPDGSRLLFAPPPAPRRLGAKTSRFRGATREGRVLRALRLDLGVSQVVLAAQIGVRRGAVSDTETGSTRPSPPLVAKFEAFFGPAWATAMRADADDVLFQGTVGCAERMVAAMLGPTTQHRVATLRAGDRRAVVCVALVDDTDTEALMVRALQTAAACVEEG